MPITTVDEYREMMTRCEAIREQATPIFDQQMYVSYVPLPDGYTFIQQQCAKLVDLLPDNINWFRTRELQRLSEFCEKFLDHCREIAADRKLAADEHLLDDPQWCFLYLRQELSDSQVGILRALVGIS